MNRPAGPIVVAVLCAVAACHGDPANRPDSDNVLMWRSADAVRARERTDVPTILASLRRRAIEDTTLHLDVEVDSQRMYLERDGVILRSMPVRVGIAPDSLRTIAHLGSQWMSTITPDTITLDNGTLIYGDPGSPGDSITDSTSVSPGNVRVRSTDLESIALALQPGNTADFYDVRIGPGSERDTLSKSYIVVSISDHRLWYIRGHHTIFETRVATGTGKELVEDSAQFAGAPAGPPTWKFDTPRGRLTVLSKETDPEWIPPDWHYVELAQEKHMGVVKLAKDRSIRLGDTAQILVSGHDVVTRYRDGREEPFEVSDGKEIVADTNIVIPPYGTNQRRYTGTLGVYRLYLGDGYGLHGTDEPRSVGQSASHGCVRLRNEDIETLYRLVPRGTVVYIY
jgi:hypothetical protein